MAGDGRAGGLAVLLVGLIAWADAWADAPRADAGQAALDAIDSCVRKLNPDIDIGYDRVAARCPTLVRRLDASGWSVWLPRDWQRAGNDLSAGGLRQLRELVSRELTSDTTIRGLTHAPSVERVPGVLASLGRSDGERGGWWGRVKAWLRDVVERREPPADEGWLARMIGQSGLSQTVIELVSYVALFLVSALAVVIVVNELRVGGIFDGLRRRFAMLADSPIVARREGGLTWDDVEQAPPLRRTGLLLELVVARLVQRGRLRTARGLTVGELTRVAQLPDEADRERLARLARTSERVRFSDAEVSNIDIAAAVEGGRVLLERITPAVDGGVRDDGVRGRGAHDGAVKRVGGGGL
jgi:hypothetical protein